MLYHEKDDPMSEPSPNATWQQAIAEKWQAAKELKTKLPSAEEAEAWSQLVDGKVQSVGETLRVEMEQTLQQSGEKVGELAAILEMKLQALSQVLRTEIATTMTQYRLEMQQIYEQQHRELKRQALYQWLVVIALIVGVLIKNFSIM